MAVVINGTTGITSVNGSAAAPSVTGADTDTGIVYGTNTLSLATGGTTAVTVDSSQNVGIGTSSPAAKLQVYTAGATTNFTIQSDSANIGGVFFNDGANSGAIQYDHATDYMSFRTNGSERARIDSSGNLLVGNTSTAGSEKLNVTTSANATIARFHNDAGSGSVNGLFVRYRSLTPNNTSNQFLYCDDFTALRMEVRSNGGIANYSANNANLSDERTKTDIQDAGGYLAKICAIPVRTFKYKDQTDDLLNLGVIAQEVEAVAPELVDTAGFGETPEDGVPLKAIYQTDLQYALMKCIQEQQAIIEQLRADVEALKAK